MPNNDDGTVGAAERRKVSQVGLAKQLGAIVLDDGELWDGAERREDGKQAEKEKEASETESTSREKTPCDFFG